MRRSVARSPIEFAYRAENLTVFLGNCILDQNAQLLAGSM
jgi:hypothetical protein